MYYNLRTLFYRAYKNYSPSIIQNKVSEIYDYCASILPLSDNAKALVNYEANPFLDDTPQSFLSALGCSLSESGKSTFVGLVIVGSLIEAFHLQTVLPRRQRLIAVVDYVGGFLALMILDTLAGLFRHFYYHEKVDHTSSSGNFFEIWALYPYMFTLFSTQYNIFYPILYIAGFLISVLQLFNPDFFGAKLSLTQRTFATQGVFYKEELKEPFWKTILRFTVNLLGLVNSPLLGFTSLLGVGYFLQDAIANPFITFLAIGVTFAFVDLGFRITELKKTANPDQPIHPKIFFWCNVQNSFAILTYTTLQYYVDLINGLDIGTLLFMGTVLNLAEYPAIIWGMLIPSIFIGVAAGHDGEKLNRKEFVTKTAIAANRNTFFPLSSEKPLDESYDLRQRKMAIGSKMNLLAHDAYKPETLFATTLWESLAQPRTVPSTNNYISLRR